MWSFIRRSENKIKVYYDGEADVIYLEFGKETPDGVIELSEGVNLDTTSEERIVGVEILNASKRIDLTTILSYRLDLHKAGAAIPSPGTNPLRTSGKVSRQGYRQ